MPKILNGTQNVLDILNANGLFDQLWKYVGKDAEHPIPAETISEILSNLVEKNGNNEFIALKARQDENGTNINNKFTEIQNTINNLDTINSIDWFDIDSLYGREKDGIYKVSGKETSGIVGMGNSSSYMLVMTNVSGNVLQTCQYLIHSDGKSQYRLGTGTGIEDWSEWKSNLEYINSLEELNNYKTTGIYQLIMKTTQKSILLFVSANALKITQLKIGSDLTSNGIFIDYRIFWNNNWGEWTNVITSSEGGCNINLKNDTPPGSLIQVSDYDEETSSDQLKNEVLSSGGIAFGKNNISGLKGYYINSIDTTNKKIYLSNAKVDHTEISETDNTDTSFTTPSYTIGKKFSLIVKDKENQRNHYHFCSSIVSIQNNVIIYSEDLPFNTIYDETDIRTPFFFVPSQPEIGVISIFEGGYSEGRDNKSTGNYSHAEGRETIAAGDYSHTEGRGTIAGYAAHAEGENTQALGYESHAEGYYTKAIGLNSHSEGDLTQASGMDSHAEGKGTKASGENQHVQGKYNIEDAQNSYAHIVGNGTDADNRSNAHTIDWEGNAWFAGNVTVGSNNEKLLTESKLDALVNGAPGTLDTLNEIAAALGNDPNFATTIINMLNEKANSKDLSKVATSGSYSDLTDKPIITSISEDGSHNYNEFITEGIYVLLEPFKERYKLLIVTKDNDHYDEGTGQYGYATVQYLFTTYDVTKRTLINGKWAETTLSTVNSITFSDIDKTFKRGVYIVEGRDGISDDGKAEMLLVSSSARGSGQFYFLDDGRIWYRQGDGSVWYSNFNTIIDPQEPLATQAYVDTAIGDALEGSY